MRVEWSRLILQCFVKEILVELFQPSFLHLRLCSGFLILPVPLFVPPFQILPYVSIEPTFHQGDMPTFRVLLNPRGLLRTLTKTGNDTQTLPDYPVKVTDPLNRIG